MNQRIHKRRIGQFVITGRSHKLALMCAALLFATAGCEQPAADSPPSAALPAAQQNDIRPADSTPPAELESTAAQLTAAPADPAEAAAAEDAPLETWESHYIDGVKIGYAHTHFRPLTEDGRRLIHKSGESVQRVKRFSQSIEQQIKLVSVETPDGQVVRFEEEMSDGTSSAEFRGRVDGDQVQLLVTTAGRTKEETLPWSANWRGFFAAEDSLRKRPIQPSETRRLQMFAPFLHQEGLIELAARDFEMVDLPGGSARLLKVDASIVVADVAIKTTYWIDDQGQSLKSHDKQLNLITYRTTKEQALETNDAARFDLGAASAVRVKRPLANPHDTQRVVYRVHLPDGDPQQVFANGGAQQLRVIDEHTAQIVVAAARPGAVRPPGASSDPVAEDSSPNSLIQSDDERIVRMANSVAENSADPQQVAVALERLVRRSMRPREFAPALASASDVANTLEGDCTEHAVLLAALCRARGIPARVAIGLVYYPGISGFAYHMWNEVWLDDAWYPLDATLGRGGIGAAHLKLVDSNLSGANRFSVFLPVSQVLGKLQIEIVAVE